MHRDAPPQVANHRAAVTARLREGDGLLVGLDFDGTLAPIDEDPDAPTITPACRRALEALVPVQGVTVAVVSGRSLADLRPRVGVPGVCYAGNHGLELERDGRVAVHPGADRRQPALQRVLARLEARLADVPGATIEDKGLTATVHYRRAPRAAVGDVRATVERVVGPVEGLACSAGKESVEVRPAVEWDKGAAVRHLLGREPGDWRGLYVGDDETDEDAFRALGPRDVGILVGWRPDSAADYRVPDQRAVAHLLSWLAADVLGLEVSGTAGVTPRHRRRT